MSDAERPIALVTGGGRGIGAAICKDLAAAGFHVWINYVRDDKAAGAVEDAIRSAGGSAERLRFDVADRDATRAVLEERFERGEVVKVLVNNAAVHRDNVFFFMSDAEWDDVIGTNLGGFYNVTAPVVRAMKRERVKGRIISVASYAGVVGNRGQVNYAASKAAVIAASRSLAMELARDGVAVNVVAPGFVATDMTASVPPELVRSLVPSRRMGSPEEVAEVVRFLATTAPDYLTGQVIGIDGGLPS